MGLNGGGKQTEVFEVTRTETLEMSIQETNATRNENSLRDHSVNLNVILRKRKKYHACVLKQTCLVECVLHIKTAVL